jgi:predicted nucleic acid-binding protein
VIVVDASALVEVLLNTSAGSGVAQRLFTGNETLHAPHLLDLEIAHALRRFVLIGDLDPARGLQVLEDLSGIALRRYPHDLFLIRIWELRHNLTAYDAAYIALAEALGAPLITRDAALVSAAGHHARIELI